MGDLLGSFPRKCASEDKARWKDLSWFVGLVVIPESSHSDVGRHSSSSGSSSGSSSSSSSRSSTSSSSQGPMV